MFLDDIALHLLMKSPFYSHLLRGCRIEIDNKIPFPACVYIKDKIVMKLNKDQLSKMSVELQAGIIEHELNHVVRGHITQANDKLPDHYASKVGRKNSHPVFNIAIDSEINPTIPAIRDNLTKGLPMVNKINELKDKMQGSSDKEKETTSKQLEEMMKDGVFIFPESFGEKPGKTWVNYYLKLLEDYPEDHPIHQQNGDQDNQGNEDNGFQPSSGHDYFKESTDDPEMAEHVTAKAIEGAKSKNHGNAPVEANEFLVEFKKKQTLPWTVLLKQFIQSLKSTERRSTWKKVNRRFPELMPGFKKEPKLKIAVGLDSSGSVGNEEWEAFAHEIQAIHAAGVELHIIEFESQVSRFYRFEGEMLPRKDYGGTDFRPVHDLVKEENFKGLIMLTDGCGPYPEVEDVDYQTLWVLTDGYYNQEPPYGRIVKLPSSKN